MQPLEQQLGQAFQLLQAGNASAAKDMAKQVGRAAPKSPDAHHLLALCDKALGNAEAASKSFRKAIQLAPRNAQIITNYANFLLSIDRHNDAIKHYKNACRLAPDFLNAHMGLGAASLAAGDSETAIGAYQHVIDKQPNASTAWQGLGSAYRKAGRLEAAQDALRKAVETDARNAAAWLNLGVIQRMLGDLNAAEASLNKAEASGFNGPELLDARASVQLDLGQIKESIEGFRALTQEFPAYVPGHDALARVRWEHAPQENPIKDIAAAALGQPKNLALQLSYLRMLVEAEKWDDVIAHVKLARSTAPHPALDANEANALEAMGQTEQAERIFRRVIKDVPGDTSLRNAYARLLIRAHRPDEAVTQLLAATEIDFADQMAWAYLGTCWRLTGDTEREDWLHGYDRFIAPLDIDVPDGFASVEEFCSALELALLPMHGAEHEPIDQSLRHGTQTPGHLFGHPQGDVRAARDAISNAIVKYQANLPIDPEHPFLARSSPAFRYQGAWSVRLRSSGFHVNHIHQDGWLSSAFYVVLPPCVDKQDPSHAGWIQFGQPPLDLNLDLEPRRYVQPKVGRLAVFPSYTWHGTVPFEDESPRITMAYDVVPKD